jgi:hypothetical protein
MRGGEVNKIFSSTNQGGIAMLKNLLTNIVKGFVFAITFVAYWYSLDEKFYRYREQKLAAAKELETAAAK